MDPRWLCQMGFGHFLTMQWPSTVGTTDMASGYVASERPSLLESWDSFTLGDRERGRVWMFGGLVSDGKFQFFLCFCWWVWVGAAVTKWQRVEGEAESKDEGRCAAERKLILILWNYEPRPSRKEETVGGLWKILRAKQSFPIWWGVRVFKALFLSL